MTKPLALIFYENLLPGSQLVNRLQDLGYRVHPVLEPSRFVDIARAEKPMLIIIDLRSQKADLPPVIAALKANADTGHIPILAFTGRKKAAQLAAQRCGADMIAIDEAVSAQLPQLLEQILAVD